MTEKTTDSVLLALAEEIKRDEAKTAFLNPARIRDMRDALSCLRCLWASSGLSITYQLHAPVKSMGCITVEGREIVIRDPSAFTHAVELASNVDIYPLADGGVCMDFAFHGLTKQFA